MYFDSLQALWEMAGHGPYVWICYAIGWSVLLALFIQPIRKRKKLLKAIKLRRMHEQESR